MTLHKLSLRISHLSRTVAETKNNLWGTSLAVQWLSLFAPNSGYLCSILGQETRSHMPQLGPGAVRPKIQAFVPRWRNHATQETSPADATSKRVYFRLGKPGDSDLLRGRAPRTADWASFLYAKNHTISILHTGYKVIGYNIIYTI